ncbi:hypothetical protein, partial [uncultured Gemmiger sp.]|uniref:hypothetical protein n=1 Tax=uncultured Gemmiger sp. TaxID=1623490 RepID=UPI00345C36C3
MQKTNFKTRLLALLTAVFMVVMCVPFAAFADVESIHVAFSDENGLVKEYDITAKSDEYAPELPDGYYWKTNLSSDGVSDLTSNQHIDFNDLAKANWPYVGFTKTEKPEVKKTVEINLNTDNNKGTFVGYDGAATISFKNLPENGDPIALPKVEDKDGYKFTGWKVEGAGEAGHLDANATEFGYTGVAHFPKDS